MNFFNPMIMALTLILCFSALSMQDDACHWTLNDDESFLIFVRLAPSEKKVIPLVCQKWLVLAKNVRFAQAAFQQYKELTLDRVAKGNTYCVNECLRLERVVPSIVGKLMESPYFWNLGENARITAEQIVREAFKIQAIPQCLMRNSSHDHLIAISFIDGQENTSAAVDCSPSVHAIKIRDSLAQADSLKMLNLDVTKPKGELTPVFHMAVEVCERAKSKELYFAIKGIKGREFKSVEALISYLEKKWFVLVRQ